MWRLSARRSRNGWPSASNSTSLVLVLPMSRTSVPRGGAMKIPPCPDQGPEGGIVVKPSRRPLLLGLEPLHAIGAQDAGGFGVSRCRAFQRGQRRIGDERLRVFKHADRHDVGAGAHAAEYGTDRRRPAVAIDL